MQTNKNNFLKRRSELDRTNRIRLELFSLAKNEINEKKKVVNSIFSFSANSIKPKDENQNIKDSSLTTKQISLESKNTLNDSSEINEEENSSDISCDEEEI